MSKKNHLFIDPLTDYGFKKLFGEEANKDFLIAFLNSILPKKHQVKDIEFMPTIYAGESDENRKLIYDIHCISTKGEHFIVEMQREKMQFFKDRSVFYVSRAISNQVPSGDWDFRLEPIYMVAILDFKFDTNTVNNRYKTNVWLKDENGDVFYDKLNFCFIELVNFNKKEDELETHFDKWLFFLKNLESFNDLPAILNEPIFKKALEVARKANMSHNELEVYNQSKKIYLDMMNIVETAKKEAEIRGERRGKKEGEIRGIEKEKLTIARIMLKNGEAIEKIKKYTGLTLSHINKLRRQMES